ncbi:MAG: type II toxin-antitoxin system RelE/ParE family toxin [Acidobacteriaceae bacterium]|nr:type II toxin-antitoxin system RelE/ParE family toxin [Acidobacteriaceae bacterium]
MGKKIFGDIQSLADNPRPHGYEQLTGKGKLYRLPVGPGKDYRIIYEVEDDKLLISILKIGDRKEIYRDL